MRVESSATECSCHKITVSCGGSLFQLTLQIASDPTFGIIAGWSVAAGIQGRDIHTTYMMEGMMEGSESR